MKPEKLMVKERFNPAVSVTFNLHGALEAYIAIIKSEWFHLVSRDLVRRKVQGRPKQTLTEYTDTCYNALH